LRIPPFSRLTPRKVRDRLVHCTKFPEQYTDGARDCPRNSYTDAARFAGETNVRPPPFSPLFLEGDWASSSLGLLSPRRSLGVARIVCFLLYPASGAHPAGVYEDPCVRHAYGDRQWSLSNTARTSTGPDVRLRLGPEVAVRFRRNRRSRGRDGSSARWGSRP